MRSLLAGMIVLTGMISSMSVTSRAQSFDCKLAKTPIEKAICGSPELSKLDTAMAAKYRQELAEIPTDVQADLKQTQIAWLRSLPAVCKANAPQMGLTQCLIAQYKGQLQVLDEQVQHRSGVTFVRRTIELLAKDDADDPWLKEKDLAQNAGFGTLDASWPQALSSDPLWLAWNAAVLAETQKMAAGDVGKSAHGWQKEWASGADATVTATLNRVGPQIVSVAIANEMMGHGAAHPNESYETFHWMLNEQRALKVSDVFTAGSGWENVVSAHCRSSLKQQVGADYQSYAGSTAADFAKTLHSVVSDPSNWDLDAKGLTISFPEYSVTARAEPVDGVLVPWSALSAFLAKGFLVPK